MGHSEPCLIKIPESEFLRIKFGSHQYPYLLVQTVFLEKEAKTILLDICCGTGSIGIALADRFDKVYGIEMVQSAIDDANMNIKKNNLENCIFECGKAENRMRDISIEVSKVNNYGGYSIIKQKAFEGG